MEQPLEYFIKKNRTFNLEVFFVYYDTMYPIVQSLNEGSRDSIILFSSTSLFSPSQAKTLIYICLWHFLFCFLEFNISFIGSGKVFVVAVSYIVELQLSE